MPHSCVKCNKSYPDQSEAILKGCTCGSRIFYFIKTDAPAMCLPTAKVTEILITEQLIELSKEKPVVINLDDPENIRVIEPGSYELNIPALFRGDPVILRTDSDVYYVKLPAPKSKAKK
ncbi:MAG: Zn-ribbon containing protein [Candidatus Micrarchaeota archaeon]